MSVVVQLPAAPTGHPIGARQAVLIDGGSRALQRSQQGGLSPPLKPPRSDLFTYPLGCGIDRNQLRVGRAMLAGLHTHAHTLTFSLVCFQKERLRRERRTGSPATGSPVRRAESPAMFTRRSASPATPKLLPKSCTQSPCTVRQYHSSPIRHRPTTPVTDSNKKEDGQVEEAKGHNNISDRNVSKPETPVKKMSDIQSPEKSSQADTAEKKLSNTETPEKRFPKTETPSKNLKGEISEKKDNPDKKSPMAETADRKASKIDTPDKKMPKSACSDLNTDNNSTEPSSVTPTGKGIAGTTSAEEASRLLAERRRLARVQKELEEKQRCEQEEDERLKAEQLRRRQAEERARQEEAARRAEEERSRQEDLRRTWEEEEKLQKEGQDKELQVKMDREKEEAELQAQKDAERQRQEREILKLQQEEERHLRKKRIEEIMKRTRKSDENQAEMKVL
ncbi:unnamed protein product [Oncorhynchus mykiss]|uniref:Uncharacterized protein n=1 Tax=Oncorhynchus mykiss TaxID=8022 RepID=A0A060ZD73_ONCMY|nr:unnamed protein product [Oncorhynchus mykiss]